MNITSRIFCRIFQKAFKAANPVLPYKNPQKLYRVEEIAVYLTQNNLKKPLIVTDKMLYNMGVLDGLTQSLANHAIPYALYDETTPNPTVSQVEAARALYISQQCDCVIGFGGGSAMDCAKGVAARIGCPRKSIQKMEGILRIHRKLPTIIAVATTAGTGSETTPTIVITDDKTHHKFPISDFPLIPKVAVLDASLTQSLPPSVTATTGMDALTHAVEAYIGGSTNKKTRAWCIRATQLIFDNLETVYQNKADDLARKNMMEASFLAGASFSQSYVGYCHAVAHALGGQYGVAHGLANAVLLPKVLKSYGKNAHKRVADLARKTKVCPADTPNQEAYMLFIRKIEQMNQNMGIPAKIEGIERADIPKLAKQAAKEANPLYPVPKLMNATELEMLFLAAMEE